jgi:ArsR family transcriptional regulator
MSTQTKQKPCGCKSVAARRTAQATYDCNVDLVFRAFSERTRLRILHLLLDGEMCVGDIVTILQTTQPRASQHLAYLRKAGLVVTRKAGLWSFYSLAPARTPFHKKLLECLQHCFSEVPELQADVRRAATLRREGGGCCDSRG